MCGSIEDISQFPECKHGVGGRLNICYACNFEHKLDREIKMKQSATEAARHMRTRWDARSLKSLTCSLRLLITRRAFVTPRLKAGFVLPRKHVFLLCVWYSAR